MYTFADMYLRVYPHVPESYFQSSVCCPAKLSKQQFVGNFGFLGYALYSPRIYRRSQPKLCMHEFIPDT